MRKEKTIKIDNKVFKLIVYQRKSLKNPCGFFVKINNKKYFFNVLSFQEAFDLGFSKYLKEEATDEKYNT